MDAAKRQIHAGTGFWWAAGILLLLGLVLTQAPAWAHVLAAGVWVLGVWLLRVVQALQQPASPPLAQPASVMPSLGPERVAELPVVAVAPGTQSQPAVACVAEPVPEAAPEPEPELSRDVEQDMLRYALSHDLRAPLRVIDGFTRIVKEDYGRHLDRLGQDHLDRVLSASARMNGMIDAVLAQAQLAGASLAREDIDLSALAREVSAELQAVHGSDAPSAAPVQWQIDEGLRTQADPQLVRRVLENLLGNALKYSAKVAEPRVEFGCMPATNPPVYFVRDNGAGFDMQHADKLFGMFQRLHSAKDFPGTGVGLAGVRNIVRRHGGRVWAEAQAGQGACFYFTLIGTAEAQRSASV